MIACATAKTEYITEVPSVDFPVFPPPDCVEYDEATDMVSMPLWYWQKIAEYKIDVDGADSYLRLLRQRALIDKTGGMNKPAAETKKKADEELEK
jgi:hypothetical protein